MHCKLQV